jgi:phage terminase small subunit
LHRLHGTFHTGKHGRDRAGEPVAKGDLMAPPRDLTPGQKRLWRYAIRHAPKGVLKAIDRDMLRLWVETLERHDEARQILEAEESAVLWLTSPCHRIIDRTTALLVRLAGELGFSPVSRARIRTGSAPEAVEDDPNNPWRILRLVRGGKGELPGPEED